MVFTLTFSTLSMNGTLKPNPGCAVPMTAPVRSNTPRSAWSTVYQLPKMIAIMTRPATAAPMIARFIPNLLMFGRVSCHGLTIMADRSADGCDLNHCVGGSGDLVQGDQRFSMDFQDVAAVHSMARPAAIMMASMMRRKTSGSSLSTNRLAMKAPNISEEPAIRPLMATSEVSAPKRSKVTDLLRYSPSELAASVARKAPLLRP